jgi:hypothetical protein
MLQHCGKCHAERLRQLADGGRSAAQPFQDLPAGRLDKSAEDAVDLGMVKHGLEYCADRINSQVCTKVF